MQFVAFCLATLALTGTTVNGLCGLTKSEWRLRKEVSLSSMQDVRACFAVVYGDAHTDIFGGRFDKFLTSFTNHTSDKFQMNEQSPSGSWVNDVESFTLFYDNRCAKGTHDITATLTSGSTISAKVEGVFAVREDGGKYYLYYGLKKCEGVGNISDEQLDEMCNTRIPTHHLTNLKRGACLVTNCNNPTLAISTCSNLNIDPDV